MLCILVNAVTNLFFAKKGSLKLENVVVKAEIFEEGEYEEAKNDFSSLEKCQLGNNCQQSSRCNFPA